MEWLKRLLFNIIKGGGNGEAKSKYRAVPDSCGTYYIERDTPYVGYICVEAGVRKDDIESKIENMEREVIYVENKLDNRSE